MMLRSIVALTAALGLLSAAPQTARFAPATQSQLANGVRIVTQPVGDTPLLGAQLFVPSGVAAQSPDRAGVAAVAADMVLHTPVDGRTVLDVAKSAGAQVSYTLDPSDTRYTIDCRASDFPAIFHSLVAALAHPDPSKFAGARQHALDSAAGSVKNPVATILAMIREINYVGTGLEYLDTGRGLTLARMSATQATGFVQSHLLGGGTVLALTGSVTQPLVDAAGKELSQIPAGPPPRLSSGKNVTREHQIVAHRNVTAPWVGVGYQAPSQYSKDFAAMLVVSALLGQEGDVHALSFSSTAPLPEDYVGAYYQYEAQPGSLIFFLSGAEGTNIDQSIQELRLAIARLRVQSLPASLVDHGRRLAIGQYYTSVTTLADAAWVQGRAALSPMGLRYVDALPNAIARVTGADVRRVAQKYLQHETIGIVLPQTQSGR